MTSRSRKQRWPPSRRRECSQGVVALFIAIYASFAACSTQAAEDPYAGKKKILIVADLHTGNQIAHDGVSHAMATLERLGRESGTYIAFLRTDTQLVTKAEV